MAIQIRRGSNATWEVNKSNILVGEPAVTTDTKRAFIGTSTGHYMELANIESVAPAFNESTTYNTGDVVTYRGLMWVAITETSGIFNSADWEQMSIGNMLSQFNEHLYDGYEKNTIENVEIASFDNGAGGIPVVDLAVDIEATQDLHGYSHPWAGGAGKNLFPLDVATIKSLNTSGTWNGNAYTLSGVTFTLQTDSNGNILGINVNGTATVQVNFAFSANNVATSFSAKRLTVDSGTTGSSGSTSRIYWEWYDIDNSTWQGVATDSYTTSRNANQIRNFKLQVFSGATISNKVYKPMLNEGTTALPFEPYSNICPINGYNEVAVNVTGTNVWDEEWEVGVYDSNGNKYSQSDVIRCKNKIPVLPNTKYYVHVGNYTALMRRCFYTQNGTFISYADSSVNTEITTPANSYYMTFNLQQSYGATYRKDISINHPSTDTAYHTYNGNRYKTAMNLWDEETELGGISQSTGGNVDNTTTLRTKNYVSVLPNTRYYLNTTKFNTFIGYDQNKNFVQAGMYVNAGDGGYYCDVPNNVYYIRWQFSTTYGTTYNHDISFTFPSTEHSYIPYKGSTATQNYMNTFGKGVYGGTLDVTTGVLTVTHKAVDGGSLSWGYWAGDNFYTNVPEKTSIDGKDILCSYYATINYNSGLIGTFTLTGNDFQKECIYVCDPQYAHNATGASALKTNVTGQTFVYRLKTPLTYQLSPQEVDTVYKTNNLWSNGHIKVLVYRMTRH